jgi:hypothetical protein
VTRDVRWRIAQLSAQAIKLGDRIHIVPGWQ